MMESSVLTTYISGVAITLIGLYLINGACASYFFPRKDSLVEKFPFHHTFILSMQTHRILDLVQEYFALILKERGGKTFILNVLGLPPFVMTNDIENITHILKTNFENYGKSSHVFKPKFQGLLGNGIFNADGQQWFAHRKTSAHLFKLEQFKTSVLSVFNEDVDQVIDLINKKMSTGSSFDFQDIMQRFTLESISKIAFGSAMGCIVNEKVDFAYDFDYCSSCINNSMINPFWRFVRYFTPAGWKYFFCLWRLNRIAYSVIRERRATLAAKQSAFENEGEDYADDSNSGDSKSGERVDLLSLYLNKENFEPNTLDSSDSGKNDHGSASPGGHGTHKYRDTYLEPSDANLRDVFLNMIIAGRDTTANALSWSCYRLCIHPEIQTKLREEVRSVLTSFANGTSTKDKEDTDAYTRILNHGGHGAVSYRALQNMRYLEAFAMEVLRLHPSVPKEAKGCQYDDVLPDGTRVRKGDVVAFLPWVMGRDTDLWGADAAEFKPTRFLDQPKPNPFVFTAFQAGPRTCLGQHFALLEIKCAIARLLLAFDFALAQEPHTVTYGDSLTLPIKGGLAVSAKSIL